MDTMWAFRQAYEEARKVKDAQDAYCTKAQAGLWEGLPPRPPTDLKWEALVDVLRGKVKVALVVVWAEQRPRTEQSYRSRLTSTRTRRATLMDSLG